jgi:hypothetical protein
MKEKIILLVLSFFVFSCSVDKNLLPEEFFGLKLKKKLSGIEAKNFVDELHFNEVAPAKNEIGFYESPTGNAIIYITHYDNPSISDYEYEKMINKISPENSVFSDPEFININGKEIYKCYWLGQLHYVFTNNNELFWISIDKHLGVKFLEEYINYIR